MAKDLILWDGECGFCKRAVMWAKVRDHEDRFTPLPYQQTPSPPMTPALYTACEKAVHVVKADGTILRAGKAALYIGENVGFRLPARLAQLPPFIWAVEYGYKIVAGNRDFFARFFFRPKKTD
ncbi:MAG: DUF393 domain-containing protein [Chthonomonadaceae bacterium]|nr:DUF393 domain-containing protein [Chthonomonadaceae bacterium]